MAESKTNREVTLTARLRDLMSTGLGRLRKQFSETDKSGTRFARSGTGVGRTLRGIESASKSAAAAVGRVGSGLAGLARRAGAVVTSLSPLGVVLAGIATVLSARKLADWSDEWVLTGNRIRLVTESLKEQRAAQEAVFRIAQRTRSALGTVVDVYFRVARSAREVGIAQERVLRITEAVNQAARLGGGTQAGIDAAIIQFGQIVASRDVSAVAQELNSLREQAPRLFQAILDGFGVTRNELLKMIEEGKVQAVDFLEAIESQAGTLNEEFARLVPTIAEATTRLGNSAVRLVGILSGETGAGANLASFISNIADQIDSLADTVEARVQQIRLLFQTAFSDTADEGAIRAAQARIDRIIAIMREAAIGLVGAVLDALLAAAKVTGAAFARVFSDAMQDQLSDVTMVRGSRIVPLSSQGVLRQERQALQELIAQYDELRAAQAAGLDTSTIEGQVRPIADVLQIVQRQIEETLQRIRVAQEAADREQAEGMRQRNREIAQAMTDLERRLKGVGAVVRGSFGEVTDELDAAVEDLREFGIVIEETAEESENASANYRRLGAALNELRNFGRGAVETLQAIGRAALEGAFAARQLGMELEERTLRAFGREAEADRIVMERRMAAELHGAAPAVRDALLQTQAAERARFEFDLQRKAAVEGLTQAEEDHARTLQMVDARLAAGNMTRAEARDRIREQDLALRDALAAAEEELQGLADSPFADLVIDDIERIQLKIAELEAQLAATSQDFETRFRRGFQNATAEAMDFGDTAEAVGDRVGSALGDGLSGVFVDVISGTRSMGDAFRSWASSLLSDLARVIARFAILRALQSFGLPGFNAGGEVGQDGVVARNSGGFVPGSGPDRDSVAAVLTPGEYVIRRAAVQKYGPRVLAALNAGVLPASLFAGFGGSYPAAMLRSAFNTGGEVASGGEGSPSRGYIVASESEAERLLAGGRNAYIRFFRENFRAISAGRG